jgi:riboflavin synthase
VFTGIIEDKGRVVRMERQGSFNRMTLEAPMSLTELSLGDSINVNGVCLTLVEKRGQVIAVDISSETLQRTNLSKIREGDDVNLERALKLADRLGGHFVTGHVDGVGTITEERKEGDFLHIRIRMPQSVMKYIVQKGSIAIDGISLTVNECQGDEIRVTLIPFTLQKTTLLEKRVGEWVNVETDILGKYVESLLGPKSDDRKDFDREFLKMHGFLKE